MISELKLAHEKKLKAIEKENEKKVNQALKSKDNEISLLKQK